MSEDINPEELPAFAMPDSIIEKIYEFTGSSEDNKGFVLFFVDQAGAPQVISSCRSAIIEMGIIKAMEEYLDQFSLANNPNPGDQE
jgi:hypothetical protein|tara:strand:+ start:6993 stop:7250 length:258 start_codon:yes stop_codon:yes gene_type:complete